jgi:hypothetical protein
MIGPTSTGTGLVYRCSITVHPTKILTLIAFGESRLVEHCFTG